MNDDRPTRGILYVVGLGPGSDGLLTPDAAKALEEADTVVGYRGYLEPIAPRLAGKAVVGRELGQEVERAREALRLAEQGHAVALVSSGDPGVYGMGGVACELAAREGTTAEVVVVPGVTAACSAAALLGAPLAHDWACVSLSDLLTPWDVILRRVEAAARADFVLVLYNPASRSRTHQLATVASLLLAHRAASTPVGLVENAYREGQRVEIVPLSDLALGRARVNMFTTVVVGSSRTFASRGRMVTPRIYAAKAGTASDDAPEAPRGAQGERIMEESLAIVEREMGPHPADPAERAVVRRVIHASADFDFADTMRFGPGAIESAVGALRRGAPIVTDVEMLRAGVRRDLAGPLGVSTLCGLNDPEAIALAEAEGLTRSAAGLRRAAGLIDRPAIVAIGNAPTALEEALRMVREGEWAPSCIVGIPVGFVGVEEAKRHLIRDGAVAYITSEGRKGGSAVTAAAVNALLELAGAGGG
jgi:precorrin-3B C17-methyltransferase